jgi:hypothetical protein
MRKKDYLTLNQLFLSRRIWWIRSRPTLLRAVLKDKETNNYLKTVIITDKKPRYYFLPNDIEKYIKAFNEKNLCE